MGLVTVSALNRNQNISLQINVVSKDNSDDNDADDDYFDDSDDFDDSEFDDSVDRME